MHTPILLTYSLLGLAVLAAWLPPFKFGKIALPPWLLVLAAACTAGRFFGLLSWQALGILGILAAVSWAASTQKSGIFKAVLLVTAGALTLALSLHKFPGFVNPALATGMRLADGAPPFMHRLSFDKAAAGLILFGFLCVRARTGKEWASVWRSSSIMLGTPAIVVGTGLAVGVIGVDIKWAAYLPIFLVANLLFTCVTEEAFFRGLLQHQLAGAFARWKSAGAIAAVLIAALLFGVAHAGGGVELVLLATLAGVGYGYAYLHSKRIEAAILTHFALNALHVIFFSYPRL